MEFDFIYSASPTGDNYFICWDGILEVPQLFYTGKLEIERQQRDGKHKKLSFHELLQQPHLQVNDILVLTVNYTFNSYENAKKYIIKLQKNALQGQTTKELEKLKPSFKGEGYIPNENNFDILFHYDNTHPTLEIPVPMQRSSSNQGIQQRFKTGIKLAFFNDVSQSITHIPDDWKSELSKLRTTTTTDIHAKVSKLFNKERYTNTHITIISILILQ